MNEYVMQFPGNRGKALTLSYDDGVEQDIKLIELAQKYGIKGTFNLNSGCYPDEDVVYAKGTIHRRMPKSKVTDIYKDCGWEIAAHGYNHPLLSDYSLNTAVKQIIDDREALEEQFGTFVRGFAYPYGFYSDELVDILRNCGIEYARTVNSTRDINMPADWLRLSPTAHHNDPKLMDIAKYFLEDNRSWGPKMFYLWGHSYEFEADDNWKVIEDFMKLVGGRDDVWYATNIEIYDYHMAFKRLIFDCNMTRCYNPSAIDVYFEYHDKKYVVKGGCEISL